MPHQYEMDLGDKKKSVPYIFHTSLNEGDGIMISVGRKNLGIVVDEITPGGRDSDSCNVMFSIQDEGNERKIRMPPHNSRSISMAPYGNIKLGIGSYFPNDDGKGSVGIALIGVPIDLYRLARIMPDGTIREINTQGFL